MAEATKLHVRKGDTVVVLAGKDKGKQGKVVAAFPKKSRVTVEGVNQVKRHTKPSQKNPQGGIVEKEAPIASSNVMIICPACKKPKRKKKVAVGDGFARACKKCGEVIDK